LESLKNADNLVIRNIGVKTRFHVLIFCNNDANQASLQAAETMTPLFIPGVDKITLIHIAKQPKDVPKAQKLLMMFEPSDHLMKVEKVVLIQPAGVTLVDYMIQVVRDKNPDLVVMGSEKLSRFDPDVKANGAKASGMGSVALSMVRRCKKSMFIFKAGSMMLESQKPRTKWLVSVHQANMGLLRFCSKVMNSDKDTLLLARVTPQPTSEEERMSAKLLDAFEDEAVAHGLTPYISHIRGSVHKKMHVGQELAKVAKEARANVMCVQVAEHLEPSESVQTMLKSAGSGVLIYKERKKNPGP